MEKYTQVVPLLIVMLLFSSLQMGCIQAQTPDEKVDKMFTSWDSKTTPGVAVAVVRDGAI